MDHKNKKWVCKKSSGIKGSRLFVTVSTGCTAQPSSMDRTSVDIGDCATLGCWTWSVTWVTC